jgi:hypothetical protein
MATVDDVEQGVCNALAAVLFPGQSYLAGAVATCSAPWLGVQNMAPLSIQTRLGISEPSSTEMEADLQNFISNLAVVRVAGAVRSVNRLAPEWIQTSGNVPQLLASLAAGAVTWGGLAGIGTIAGVTAGGVCYAYRCGAQDTAASVCQAFAAAIPGGLASGLVLTAPAITAVNVVCDQTVFWRTGEKETLVQVIIIATPASGMSGDGPLRRAALTRLVYGLDAIQRPDGSLTRYIGLPDGTQARIFSVDERDDDTPNRDDMWKRTITFRVLYDAGVSQVQTPALAVLTTMNANSGRLMWIGDAAPVSEILTDGDGNVLADLAGDILGAR